MRSQPSSHIVRQAKGVVCEPGGYRTAAAMPTVRVLDSPACSGEVWSEVKFTDKNDMKQTIEALLMALDVWNDDQAGPLVVNNNWGAPVMSCLVAPWPPISRVAVLDDMRSDKQRMRQALLSAAGQRLHDTSRLVFKWPVVSGRLGAVVARAAGNTFSVPSPAVRSRRHEWPYLPDYKES